MNPDTVLLFAGFAIVGGAVGGATVVLYQIGSTLRDLVDELRDLVSVERETLALAAPGPEVEARHAAPQVDPRTRITDPPMIDGVTVRDYLLHLHREPYVPPPDDPTAVPQGVWAHVVTDFYARAASVPVIANYFRNTNLDAQRNHFLRALDIVLDKGLTAGTVDAMRRKHAGVTNSDGVPITGDIYDSVVDTLVAVLADHGVPPRGLDEVDRAIAPLRPVIVRA